jgi:hypothetical protein
LMGAGHNSKGADLHGCSGEGNPDGPQVRTGGEVKAVAMWSRRMLRTAGKLHPDHVCVGRSGRFSINQTEYVQEGRVAGQLLKGWKYIYRPLQLNPLRIVPSPSGKPRPWLV